MDSLKDFADRLWEGLTPDRPEVITRNASATRLFNAKYPSEVNNARIASAMRNSIWHQKNFTTERMHIQHSSLGYKGDNLLWRFPDCLAQAELYFYCQKKMPFHAPITDSRRCEDEHLDVQHCTDYAKTIRGAARLEQEARARGNHVEKNMVTLFDGNNVNLADASPAELRYLTEQGNILRAPNVAEIRMKERAVKERAASRGLLWGGWATPSVAALKVARVVLPLDPPPPTPSECAMNSINRMRRGRTSFTDFGHFDRFYKQWYEWALKYGRSHGMETLPWWSDVESDRHLQFLRGRLMRGGATAEDSLEKTQSGAF